MDKIEGSMLTEEDVIGAVCDYLSRQGYRINQQLGPTQHGVDIIAMHLTSDVIIRIEAKGETSSRPGSRRFGKTFSRAQSCVHVAAALYTAIATNDAHSGRTIGWASPFPLRSSTESSSAGSE